MNVKYPPCTRSAAVDKGMPKMAKGAGSMPRGMPGNKSGHSPKPMKRGK